MSKHKTTTYKEYVAKPHIKEGRKAANLACEIDYCQCDNCAVMAKKVSGKAGTTGE